ncbi:hypothetical protein chiPu_0027222 [Chiloscyllium punctatum]|uniref:Uncharacterized protein n=1 Tax=Chiloscyllium punctatum TaxID=137246 RepID=A0A401TK57_CHIPU|nr:hypothetical protein [Chiloscyllium punctatum]
MAGMPNEVKEAMESNPDISGCSTEQWEKHLAHHMKCHRTKQDEDKQSNESAQVQLLKLQLDEARRKANDTKKASQKMTHQMVQQPLPQNNLPSLDPTPDWMPHHLHHGGRPIGVAGGMRGRGRGHGGLRGQPPNTCFECGQPGIGEEIVPCCGDPREARDRSEDSMSTQVSLLLNRLSSLTKPQIQLQPRCKVSTPKPCWKGRDTNINGAQGLRDMRG